VAGWPLLTVEVMHAPRPNRSTVVAQRHSYRQQLATSKSVDSRCSRTLMLQRMALASAKVLANLQTPCRRSSLLGKKDALHLPALSRSLTGGEVREAARNAKAYLLRAHAASGQATDAQTAPPAQSSFLNLSVDDRVVVSPAVHLFGVTLNGSQRLHRSWRAS